MILGPLLFLIHINNIVYERDNNNIDMYADDTTLFQSGKNLSDIQITLQTKLSNIRNWCKYNNMAINPLKMKCMLIGTANKIKSSSKLKLTIDNVAINNVTEQ